LLEREFHIAFQVDAKIVELDTSSNEESDHAKVFNPEKHVGLAFRVI